MERKKALALAGMLMILLASFALVAPIPPASANPGENHNYWVMRGDMRVAAHLVGTAPDWWGLPFPLRPPYIMPLLMSQNITFSDPWNLTGYGSIVNLTVPATTYVGLSNVYWDYALKVWFRIRTSLGGNSHGWIFLNATGDVDCCTFNNDTGVYWGRKNETFASAFEGQLAALPGGFPDPGLDGVAGTIDDGFGDGKPDPRGSSILFLNTTLFVEYLGANATEWKVLFEAPFPQIMTTATTYDIIIESESVLNGGNSTVMGQPWEFYAGLDHPGDDLIPHTHDKNEYEVPYGHPKWNAYVTYVSVWSVLNVGTTLGDLDLIMEVVETKVRGDCAIADVDGNELVDSMDILVAGLAFGAKDEGFGPDGKPFTNDDAQVPDPNFDARGDLSDDRKLIDSMDILVMGLDFGSELRPTCIWRPF